MLEGTNSFSTPPSLTTQRSYNRFTRSFSRRRPLVSNLSQRTHNGQRNVYPHGPNHRPRARVHTKRHYSDKHRRRNDRFATYQDRINTPARAPYTGRRTHTNAQLPSSQQWSTASTHTCESARQPDESVSESECHTAFAGGDEASCDG